MDHAVIDRKLDSLQRCVQRIESRCPVELAALVADIDAQDVVVLNLSRAVQLCVDIAVHNYDAIRWEIVHAIAHQHRDDFRQFAACIKGSK